MTSDPVQQRWLDAEAAIRNGVMGAASVSCLIPTWDPVDLESGLRWLQWSIYEGFNVAHRIENVGDTAVVRFKNWESGKPEPTEWL